jgi:diketogulonate reductase-like aldo/keto reductase
LDDYLAALAKKYSVGPGEILLRWCIDQNITPITTSSREERLREYLNTLTFKLELKEIARDLAGGRAGTSSCFLDEEFRCARPLLADQKLLYG